MAQCCSAMLMRWLKSIAYPVYDCADCIGMGQHGCYCSYHNASAPGMPPTRWQRLALYMLSHLEGLRVDSARIVNARA